MNNQSTSSNKCANTYLSGHDKSYRKTVPVFRTLSVVRPGTRKPVRKETAVRLFKTRIKPVGNSALPINVHVELHMYFFESALPSN